MKLSRRKIIAAFSIAAVAVVAVIASTAKPVQETTGFAAPVKEISLYKTWTRVNQEPMLMQPAAAAACAALAPSAESNVRGPHKNKFVVVYVNDTGRHAMMYEQTPIFHQGSIIVKEKLSTKQSDAPELLTAMIKREKGYDPKNGDWEYLVLDGTGAKVQDRGKLKSCQSCHSAYQKTDFVARNYFSPAASQPSRQVR